MDPKFAMCDTTPYSVKNKQVVATVSLVKTPNQRYSSREQSVLEHQIFRSSTVSLLCRYGCCGPVEQLAWTPHVAWSPLAFVANFKLVRVSLRCACSGLTMTNMSVFELPPKENCSKYVSLLFRYGI